MKNRQTDRENEIGRDRKRENVYIYIESQRMREGNTVSWRKREGGRKADRNKVR